VFETYGRLQQTNERTNGLFRVRASIVSSSPCIDARNARVGREVGCMPWLTLEKKDQRAIVT
jgi:hypothetical protein